MPQKLNFVGSVPMLTERVRGNKWGEGKKDCKKGRNKKRGRNHDGERKSEEDKRG